MDLITAETSEARKCVCTNGAECCCATKLKGGGDRCSPSPVPGAQRRGGTRHDSAPKVWASDRRSYGTRMCALIKGNRADRELGSMRQTVELGQDVGEWIVATADFERSRSVGG